MKEIPLTKGAVAIVDDEDYDQLARRKWFLHGGYAKRSWWEGPHIKYDLMHHLVANALPHKKVTHINGNKLDNRKVNLRIR